MRLLRLALIVWSVAGVGCSRRSSHRDFVPPHYADGSDGLRAFFRDVLDAAQKDDRERVHDLMATTILSDDELRRLLGGSKADPLLPRYHQLIGNLVNRGAVELVAMVYDKKYDAVDAFADDNEAALTAALVEPHPLFAARVRKAVDTRGQRFDGYLYLDGRWRTFNQLAKFIDVVK